MKLTETASVGFLTQSAHGFSIVEAVVAMAIGTLAVGGAMLLNSHQLRMVKSTRESNAAVHTIAERVEQLRDANWKQITDPVFISTTFFAKVPRSAAPLDSYSEKLTISAWPDPTACNKLVVEKAEKSPANVLLSGAGLSSTGLARVDVQISLVGQGSEGKDARNVHRYIERRNQPHALAGMEYSRLGELFHADACEPCAHRWRHSCPDHLHRRHAESRLTSADAERQRPRNYLQAQRQEMNCSPSTSRRRRAFALADMMVGTAIAAVIAAGMLTGIVALQRSFRAAHHHAKSQVEQTRLVSYISRDLRRAVHAEATKLFGRDALEIEMPDFYTTDAQGTVVPREPTIRDGQVAYGDPSVKVLVKYYQKGGNLYRKVDTRETILATGVKDFLLQFTDEQGVTGGQVVGVSVSFVPKFQLNPANDGPLRAATTVYATTLLRNKKGTSAAD
jgi:type II secretory pathway component PulJ